MNQINTRYTTTAKILHWLIALGIFGMFALGWYMTDLPKEANLLSHQIPLNTDF